MLPFIPWWPKNKKIFLQENKKALSLVELLVAVSAGVLIVFSASAGFLMGKNVYKKLIIKGNIVQNGRIALDRIARELRQTDEILDILPESESEALSTITFQDGHDTSTITYITYEKDGRFLKRKVTYYYFDIAPQSWVRAGVKDNFGNLPTLGVLEEPRIVAENISDLKFWKDPDGKIIHIKMVLEDRGESFTIQSDIYPRNL